MALFVYANDTFIVESFLDDNVAAKLVLDGRFTRIRDLLSGEVFSGNALLDEAGVAAGKTGYAVALKPHSLRAFRLEAP